MEKVWILPADKSMPVVEVTEEQSAMFRKLQSLTVILTDENVMNELSPHAIRKIKELIFGLQWKLYTELGTDIIHAGDSQHYTRLYQPIVIYHEVEKEVAEIINQWRQAH